MENLTYFIIGFMTAALIFLYYYHIIQKEYTWVDKNLSIGQLQESIKEMSRFQKKHPYNRSILYAFMAYIKRINYLKNNK